MPFRCKSGGWGANFRKLNVSDYDIEDVAAEMIERSIFGQLSHHQVEQNPACNPVISSVSSCRLYSARGDTRNHLFDKIGGRPAEKNVFSVPFVGTVEQRSCTIKRALFRIDFPGWGADTTFSTMGM
jgi:hypothetical protein